MSFMYKKLFLLSSFCSLFFFENIKASQIQASSLIDVVYKAMPGYQELDFKSYRVKLQDGVSIQRFVGEPVVKIFYLQELSPAGMKQTEAFVYLESFVFREKGKKVKRYVGVLPQLATVHQLPTSSEDMFKYQLSSGKIVTVPLSKIRTSLEHPKF